MKTILALSVIAVLCMPVPTVQATTATFQTELYTPDNNSTIMLIGAGTLKTKSGNCFTIRSDDGNDYFAEAQSSYIVGDYIYHSNPVNGWVEILGHAD